MISTLRDYSAGQFPNHELDEWGMPPYRSEQDLTSHTVVVQVVGADKAVAVHDLLRQLTAAPLACVDVLPSSPTVLPTAHEDADGVVDLPVRRIVFGAIFGALAGAVAVAFGGMFVDASRHSVAVLAVFGALLGAAVGGIVSGGRLAGQRATTQPQAPGEHVVLLAALLDSEDDALHVVRAMESWGVDTNVEYRLVDEIGGWRSPST